MSLFLLPEYIEREAWDGFCELRQIMQKDSRGRIPWTDRAQKIALRELGEWHKEGYDCNYILDEAVLKGWRGLFINERTPRRVERQDIQEIPADAPPTRVRVFLRIVQQRDDAKFRKDKLWETGCQAALIAWHSLEKAS